MTGVLQRYADRSRVIVACHGMVIQALTGQEARNGEVIEFRL